MASFEHEMNVHPCSITDANTMYFPASSITAFANLAVYVEHSLDICPTVSAPHLATGARRRGPTPHRQGATAWALWGITSRGRSLQQAQGSRLEDDHHTQTGVLLSTHSLMPF